MNSNEIRQSFLKFFKDKSHAIVASDLLVPRNDPTLLFTGAGMNQFKEQFMGRNITFKRAASCQKCLRTGDLENVGKTPRHHTFFEMLGNFSFGDYFKKEAIRWAWEFMTKVMAIPEEKLWVSVYKDDKESYDIWLNDIKVPKERIAKLGTHDNFWPQDAPEKGPNGPCGPCSEIFYDWGKGTGCGRAACDPGCGCERFVEIWNLVFTEFDREPDGALKPLPNKNIDTGMGLERMTAVMEGVKTNFDTDLFAPIKEKIRVQVKDVAQGDINLIADHIRAASFAIADGVSPSNEKKGYVVRKLIRRAFLKSKRSEEFLYNIVPVIADIMKNTYPEIEEKREHISAIVKEEEKRFCDTLNAAMPIFDEMLSGKKGLDGGQIFKLVDTYGLPLDVIEEEAGERKISLDVAGFEKLMEERRHESRKGSDLACEFIFMPDLFRNAPKPSYSDKLPLEAELEFMLKGKNETQEISKGDCAEIITSPQSGLFYAESGGQVGDAGRIVKTNGAMDIVNTLQADGRKVFQVIVREGVFKKGDKIIIESASDVKKNTAKNHTATHLLQAALRQVLGDHVKQSGSFVNDERLRFDFTHMKKLSARETAKIEDLVNSWVEAGVPVCKDEKTLKEAKEEGALSFFAEKYGEVVRVVSVSGISRELCGGSHVDNTAEIGVVKIVSESSVASGIRRIEAVTSETARSWIKETLSNLVKECKELAAKDALNLDAAIKKYIDDILSGKIKIDGKVIKDFNEKIHDELVKTREELTRKAKKKEKEEKSGIFDTIKGNLDNLAEKAEVFGDIKFVSGILQDADVPILKKAVSYISGKTKRAVIFLASGKEDKAYLICALTNDLENSGIDASEIVKKTAEKIGGSGGGKATFAQAGGTNPAGLEEAIAKARQIVKERICRV